MRPITAGDVMSPNVLTVPEDMTLEELASFLVENEISGAPVEDANRRLVGVVSVTDLAQAMARGMDLGPERPNPDFFVREWGDTLRREDIERLRFDEAGMRVRDIMTPSVHSVDQDTPVPEVAETLINGHIHRLLVTSGERVVGIVTTSDLLGLLVREPESA
ncbi:MAG TPA: CBS domain-containing protein [Thermoanaerobaculia bacterium]|nr:CBS domain-containing protein [Thermoanaerobaculia bacterium]